MIRMLYSFLYVSVVLHGSLVVPICATASTSQQQQQQQASSQRLNSVPSALEISHQNISSNLVNWDQDYAIMFYAPWCKYCKTLYASWEQIANLASKPSNGLTIGTFNCELDSKNTDLCQKFGVDRYPSIFYLGYGKFFQSHPSSAMKSFSKDTRNRIARYNADIYPEAVYDWILMLSTVSGIQRKWDDATSLLQSLFIGSTSVSPQVKALQERNRQLERKNTVLSEALEKYKADELFDGLEDHGDPYPLLAQMVPDKQNLPFRTCVAEMVAEYCKYHEEESHCSVASECLARFNEPKACRPEKCPFDSQRGCVVTSLCLDTAVIKQYQDALKA